MNLSSINLQTTNPPILHDRIPYPPTTDIKKNNPSLLKGDQLRWIVVVSIACIIIVAWINTTERYDNNPYLFNKFFDNMQDIDFVKTMSDFSQNVDFKSSKKPCITQEDHEEFHVIKMKSKLEKIFFDKVFGWIRYNIKHNASLILVIDYYGTTPLGTEDPHKVNQSRYHLIAVGFLFLNRTTMTIKINSKPCRKSFRANSLLMMMLDNDKDEEIYYTSPKKPFVRFQIFDKMCRLGP